MYNRSKRREWKYIIPFSIIVLAACGVIGYITGLLIIGITFGACGCLHLYSIGRSEESTVPESDKKKFSERWHDFWHWPSYDRPDDTSRVPTTAQINSNGSPRRCSICGGLREDTSIPNCLRCTINLRNTGVILTDNELIAIGDGTLLDEIARRNDHSSASPVKSSRCGRCHVNNAHPGYIYCLDCIEALVNRSGNITRIDLESIISPVAPPIPINNQMVPTSDSIPVGLIDLANNAMGDAGNIPSRGESGIIGTADICNMITEADLPKDISLILYNIDKKGRATDEAFYSDSTQIHIVRSDKCTDIYKRDSSDGKLYKVISYLTYGHNTTEILYCNIKFLKKVIECCCTISEYGAGTSIEYTVAKKSQVQSTQVQSDGSYWENW